MATGQIAFRRTLDSVSEDPRFTHAMVECFSVTMLVSAQASFFVQYKELQQRNIH